MDIISDENYRNIKKKMEALKEKLKVFETYKEINSQLEKEEITLETQLKNAFQYSQISSDGNCPFFKTKCKNIGGISLNEYFQEVIEDANIKIEKVRKKIKENKDIFKDEDEIFIKIQTLENRLINEKDNKNKGELLRGKIIEKFNIATKNNILEIINNLQIEFEEKLNEINNMLIKHNQNKDKLIEDKTEINTLQFSVKTNENNIKEIEDRNSKIKIQIRQNNEKLAQINGQKVIVSNKIKELAELAKDKNIKERLESIKRENNDLEERKELYITHINKANELNKLIDDQNIYNELKTLYAKEKDDLLVTLDKLNNQFSLDKLVKLLEDETKTNKEISSLTTLIDEKNKIRNELFDEIKHMKVLISKRKLKQNKLKKYIKIIEFLKNTRTIYTNLPLKLSSKYREYIGIAATSLYRQISSENVNLEICEDYEVRVIDNNQNYKTIDQLSGGEQMSVALAIRLSMLKHLAGVDIYFLDEPTINLDEMRREKIADVVQDIVSELSQLFVISHDDTFDNITNNIIKLEKTNNISKKI